MKFAELEVVKLVEETNELPKDSIGTVVMVCSNPNEAYEVEFVDSEGKSILLEFLNQIK